MTILGHIKFNIFLIFQTGQLFTGDRILQIGCINCQGMSSQQIATLLKQQQNFIQLIVGRPIMLQDSVNDLPSL